MIMDQYNKVVEFMNLAGQEVKNVPQPISYKKASFRLTLIREELLGQNELVDSMKKDDRTGVLDGICDVLYVVYGALATYGLKPSEGSPRVFRQSDIVPSAGRTHYIYRTLNNMLEKYERSMLSDDLYELKAACDSIINAVYEIGDEFGVNTFCAFNEVHSSNMSKFAFTEHEAQSAITERVSQGKEDYIGAYVVQVGDYYAIKRLCDGKILKPSTFFEPDLSKFI